MPLQPVIDGDLLTDHPLRCIEAGCARGEGEGEGEGEGRDSGCWERVEARATSNSCSHPTSHHSLLVTTQGFHASSPFLALALGHFYFYVWAALAA